MRKGVKRNGFISGYPQCRDSGWAKIMIIHNGSYRVKHATFNTSWVHSRERDLRGFLATLLKKDITLKPSKKSAQHNVMVQYSGLKTPKYYEMEL